MVKQRDVAMNIKEMSWEEVYIQPESLCDGSAKFFLEGWALLCCCRRTSLAVVRLIPSSRVIWAVAEPVRTQQLQENHNSLQNGHL